MTDILYFAGTERLDFEGQVGAISTYTATTSTRRTAYSRSAVAVTGANDDVNYLPCLFSATATDFWVHIEFLISAVASNKFIKFYSGGSLKLGIAAISSSSLGVYTWNGSTWTLVSTLDTSAIGTWSGILIDFDLHIKVGNPGTIAAYWGGVPIGVTTTVDLSAITNIDQMRLQNSYNASVGYYSEVIIANFNTIGSYIKSDSPTGNGFNTAYVNDYTYVDEATDGGTDYITSSTAGQRETYTFPTITLGSNEIIAGVGVGIEAFADASSPQNINLAARVASTDYDGASKTLSASLTYRQTLWATNPNTSAAWAASEVNATELGVKSLA